MTAAGPLTRSAAAELLGVPEDASAQEVQRAFLRAARRTHPDLQQDADEETRRAAGEAFAALTDARDLLLAGLPMDPLERAGLAAPPPGAVAPASYRAPARGLGGSLVVLALLGFLLIGIVAAEYALLGQGDPGAPVDPSVTLAP